MKVSKEQFSENRLKILDAANQLFKAHGFDNVTISDVMKTAGLTHGGFYGHFKSKEDLITQSLAHLMNTPIVDIELATYIKSYLSLEHCNDLVGGCVIAGLGTETQRQPLETRAAMTTLLRRRIEHLIQQSQEETTEGKRQEAIGIWAAMVGALIMARFSDDPLFSNEILENTKAWIQGSRNL